MPRVSFAEEHLDDPSRRPPQAPPQAPLAGAPGYAQPAPGQPPYPQPQVVAPGVSLTIHNVVGGPPPQPYGTPYAPGYPPMMAAPMAPVAYGTPMAPAALPPPAGAPAFAAYPPPGPPPQPRGVVDLMRDDANKRAMDAVARTGPAKVLAYSVGGVALAGGATLAFVLVPLAILPVSALWALVPVVAVTAIALLLGRRMGAGVSTHHLEQAILRVASENEGVVRVVTLAQLTGRPLRECQVAVDAMVQSGHATVDSDANGGLIYRIPDLEPVKKHVVYDVGDDGAARGS